MAAYSARKSGGPVLWSTPQSNLLFSSRTPSFRPTSPAESFTLDRRASPNRCISASPPPIQKRTCMCSPTNHPGSFRCSLHKTGFSRGGAPRRSETAAMRRSAMTNSLVRFGTVEGYLVRRALATSIRPSSHQQRRRGQFKPCASRLSRMSR